MASKPPPGETFLNLYQFLVAQGEGGERYGTMGYDGERARREFRATAAAPAAGVRCIVAGRWCICPRSRRAASTDPGVSMSPCSRPPFPYSRGLGPRVPALGPRGQRRQVPRLYGEHSLVRSTLTPFLSENIL